LLNDEGSSRLAEKAENVSQLSAVSDLTKSISTSKEGQSGGRVLNSLVVNEAEKRKGNNKKRAHKAQVVVAADRLVHPGELPIESLDDDQSNESDSEEDRDRDLAETEIEEEEEEGEEGDEDDVEGQRESEPQEEEQEEEEDRGAAQAGHGREEEADKDQEREKERDQEEEEPEGETDLLGPKLLVSKVDGNGGRDKDEDEDGLGLSLLSWNRNKYHGLHDFRSSQMETFEPGELGTKGMQSKGFLDSVNVDNLDQDQSGPVSFGDERNGPSMREEEEGGDENEGELMNFSTIARLAVAQTLRDSEKAGRDEGAFQL